MAKRHQQANLQSTSKRRRWLLQLLSVLTTSQLATGAYAGTPGAGPAGRLVATMAQIPGAANPPAAPNVSRPLSQANRPDDFLGDNTPEEVTPDVQSAADALLDRATSPQVTELPPSTGLNAPAANLSTGLASGSLGVTRGSQSYAPAMMGDFFGSLLFDYGTASTIALAGGDRRFKISENVSPLPQDRVFFNYNHFHNALNSLDGDQFSLDRFTFGMEKATSDKLISFEFRLPFASGLNSTYDFDNPDPVATELGNVGMGLKSLMFSTDTWSLSAGTTMTLPTGNDYRQRSGGADFLAIENEAVHLAPFLGFLATPAEDWFVQGFLQTDFDLNGNSVSLNGQYEGVLQDQHLMFVDLSAGCWLLRQRTASGRTLGVAAITELHYTMTMNDPDFVSFVGNNYDNMDILNATMGMHVQYGLAALRVGAAAPLRKDEEKLFDAEVFVQASRAL
ncbi:MAG: hypothetical protein ACO1RT_09795 [Planctomycetaceae bacterium]